MTLSVSMIIIGYIFIGELLWVVLAIKRWTMFKGNTIGSVLCGHILCVLAWPIAIFFIEKDRP